MGFYFNYIYEHTFLKREVHTMFEHYKMTPLEEFVEELYKEHNITSIQQLNIDEIANRINVWVYYLPIASKGLEVNTGMYSMNVNSLISPYEQWMDFLHELCHLLRHAGNQTIMPKMFTQAQEDESHWFAVYASMPFSFIQKMDLPETTQAAVAYLASEFRVSIDFARIRLEQIQRRNFEDTLYYERNKLYILEERPEPEEYSDEAKRLLNQLQRQLSKKKSRRVGGKLCGDI